MGAFVLVVDSASFNPPLVGGITVCTKPLIAGTADFLSVASRAVTEERRVRLGKEIFRSNEINGVQVWFAPGLGGNVMSRPPLVSHVCPKVF